MVGFHWNAARRGTLHGFGDRVGIPECAGRPARS